MRLSRTSVLLIAGLLSTPLTAQTPAGGTYSGTYTISMKMNCNQVPVLRFSGRLDGGVSQTNNQLRGLFVAHDSRDVSFVGACRTVASPDTVVELLGVTLTGATAKGTLKVRTSSEEWTGTWNGTTLSGTTKDGDSINVTRTSTATGPLVAFTSDYVDAASAPARLRWTTVGATNIRIDDVLVSNPAAASGEQLVFSNGTTTYVLTATGPGGTTLAETTIKSSVGLAADVVITASPRGVLRMAGAPAVVDRFTLTNLGGTAATVAVTRNGTFFNVSPVSFTLAPLGSQTVTISPIAAAGAHEAGSVTISGTGVAAGLTLPVSSLSGLVVPAAPVIVTAQRRVDVSGATNPAGSVSFTNSGSAPVEGLVVSDTPWIVLPDAHLMLGPGESKEVAFSIDRSRRPGALIGGTTGNLVFRYVNAAGSAAIVSEVGVMVADVTTIPTAPIAAGLPGWFIPGVSSGPSTFVDLALTHFSGFLVPLSVAFIPASRSGDATSPGQFAAITQTGVTDWRRDWNVAYPGVVKNLFGASAQSGTIHFFDTSAIFLAAAATQFQTQGAVTTFTSLPAFEGDDAHYAGRDVFLPGARKDATTTTTVYVKEIFGAPMTFSVDSLDEEGRQLRTRDYALNPNGSLELPDEVAAGAATVRVRKSDGALNAQARVIDSVTGDVFTIVQPVPTTEVLYFPALGSATPGVEMMLHLGNASTSPITVTLEGTSVNMGDRRRAVGHADVETLATPRTITIPGLATRQVPVRGNGFVKLTGPASLRAAGMYSHAKYGGRIGSGVPAVSDWNALSFNGRFTRFNGIEASSEATLALARPLTWRTNLLLIETTGADPVIVKLTLRYTFPGGAPNYHAATARQFTVPAGGMVMIDDLATSIIGAEREALGDLHNAYVEVRVISRTGSVLSFLQTVDHGTGDVSVRYP